MPTAGQLSQHRFQVGDAEPVYELFVQGQRWTDDVREVRYENTEQEGGSSVTFVTRRSMRGLQDASVVLWIGYRGAPLIRYFDGILKRPMPDPATFTDTAQALGPFSEMATNFFGEKVTYSGVSLRYALYDIASKATNLPSGTVEVFGGEGKILENQVFLEEVSLLEATTSITEPMQFVQFDAPGGKRVFQGKPRPGATALSKATYTPNEWAEGGFSLDEAYDAVYSKVVVFRRGENDEYDVREEFPVGQTGRKPAPKNRIYYVPEFVGTNVEAKQAAYDLAGRLGMGESKMELTGIPINPEIQRYDQIDTAGFLIEEPDGWYSLNHQFIIQDGVSLDLTEWVPSYSGVGLETMRTKVAPSRVHVPWELSVGVMDKP